MTRLPWPSRGEPENGFTLVEVLIAMVIIGTVLIVMGATMYTAFGSIGFSRQRDTATELANQAMEQIKALNFNDLVMGTTDVSTGDSLVACSGNPTVCTFGSSPARTIPTVSSGTLPASPLSPHISTTTPAAGQSTYTVASYITFDTAGNTQARIATVRVTWTKPVRTSNPVVQIESTIFATGPIGSGPAHAWTANAADTAGNISVTGTLAGTTLANVTFGPGSTNASIAVDGTAQGNGTVAASTLQIGNLQPLLSTTQSTSTATSASGQSVSAPAQNVAANAAPLGPQTAPGVTQLVNLILQLVGGSLGVSGGVGVTSTTQALAASSANGSANISGQSMPNSSLPYAQGMAEQTGPVSLGLTLSLAGLPVLSLPIVQITPLGNSNPDLATVCQQTSSGAGCQAALPGTGNVTGVSQPSYAGPAIVAQAQKSFAQITVLPGLGTPLLAVNGYTAAASAAAGPGLSNTGKASASATSVSLNGASIPLSSLLSGITGSTNVSAGLLGLVNVAITLKFGSATTSGNTATITSPLVLTVAVTLGGTLVNLNVNFNLGDVTATASYS